MHYLANKYNIRLEWHVKVSMICYQWNSRNNVCQPDTKTSKIWQFVQPQCRLIASSFIIVLCCQSHLGCKEVHQYKLTNYFDNENCMSFNVCLLKKFISVWNFVFLVIFWWLGWNYWFCDTLAVRVIYNITFIKRKIFGSIFHFFQLFNKYYQYFLH